MTDQDDRDMERLARYASRLLARTGNSVALESLRSGALPLVGAIQINPRDRVLGAYIDPLGDTIVLMLNGISVLPDGQVPGTFISYEAFVKIQTPREKSEGVPAAISLQLHDGQCMILKLPFRRGKLIDAFLVARVLDQLRWDWTQRST